MNTVVASLPNIADRVLAMREIKRTQNLWCHLVEAAEWNQAAALFTADAEWFDEQTQVRGRAALEQLFAARAEIGEEVAGRLEFRAMLSPVITISADGRRASGRWREIALAGRAYDCATWSGGISLVDYTRCNDRWLISRVRHHQQFAGPYDKGWRSTPSPTSTVPFHFDPDEVGAPFGLGFDGARDEAPRSVGQLLDAAGAMQNLVSSFGYYADRLMLDDLTDLFCVDAELVVDDEPAVTGPLQLRHAFAALFGSGELEDGVLNDRLQLVPVFTMASDRRSATVRVLEIGMTGRHGGQAGWSLAINEFFGCKTDGRWHLTSLQRITRMQADYETGWLHPDGPPNASYAFPNPGPAVPPLPDQLIAAPIRANAVAAEPGRVREAVAFECAENLSNAYGYYIDEHMWDAAADLFAVRGWKELSYVGTYVGRERVRQSMKARYGTAGKRSAFSALHQTTQPYVSIDNDGARARGRMRLFQFNSQTELPGSWILGVYENQFVFEDGAWRIHGMDLEYEWLADYRGGWTGIVAGSNERFRPSPEFIETCPPDAPLRGETFAPYPRVAPLGFHFTNPVSGRLPEWLLRWSEGAHAE